MAPGLHTPVWRLNLSTQDPTAILANANITKTSVGGADCIHLIGNGAEQTWRLDTTMTPGLKRVAGSEIVLRYSVQATSATGQADVALSGWSDVWGGTVGSGGRADTGTYTWVEKTFRNEINPDFRSNPGNSSPLRIQVSMHGGTGDVWIKDVRITSLGPPKKAGTFPRYHQESTQYTGLRGFQMWTLAPKSDFVSVHTDYNANLLRWYVGTSVFDTFTLSNPKDSTQYDRWLQPKIAQLDSVVAWSRSNGMKVIIDLHICPGGSDATANQITEYGDYYYRSYIRYWKQIAAKFVGDNAIYAFNLMNEPSYEPHPRAQKPSDKNLASLFTDVSVAIRKIDPTRTIMVDWHYYAKPENARYMQKVVPLSNIIYDFHIYWPPEFTAQSNTTKRFPFVPTGAPTWTRAGYVQHDTVNEAHLDSVLQEVADFQDREQVPIHIGEFGCLRWNPGCTEWHAANIRFYESRGWTYTKHAYHAPDDEWDAEYDTVHVGPSTGTKIGLTMPTSIVLQQAMSINRSPY